MPFNHYGVERCQWTAEPKACPTCAEYARHNDGVYRVKDVLTLPAHPNCRCALSAYWKDEEKFASGALDGESRRGQEHARRFYNELRNSNRKDLIMKIFKSSKMSKTIVSSSLKYVLDSKYDLIYDGEIKHMNFVPDYDMAESLKRLRIGNPLKHDIITLKHEALEADLMDNKGYTYSKAHRIANKKYNYGKALKEWKEGKA